MRCGAGLPDRHTPNIDAIAANGTVFDRAYAQQAVCGPSRNSFLSGRRPDSSRCWNFINSFREDHPEWTTLPGLFLRPNALSLGAGKAYHPTVPPRYDGARSWSPAALPFDNPCFNTAATANLSCHVGHTGECDGGLPCVFCPIDIASHLPGSDVNVTVANEFCELDAREDDATVAKATALLRLAAEKIKTVGLMQFYLAVGLHKPHMPCAPPHPARFSVCKDHTAADLAGLSDCRCSAMLCVVLRANIVRLWLWVRQVAGRARGLGQASSRGCRPAAPQGPADRDASDRIPLLRRLCWL